MNSNIKRSFSLPILQCGFPKSGNFFFWQLVRHCQKMHSCYESFSIKTGSSYLVKMIYHYLNLPPIFNNIFELDEIEFYEDNFYLQKHLVSQNKIPSYILIDLELLINNSSLIWTHSKPEHIENEDKLKGIDLKFYILRDGRAAVNSLIHHVIRPDVRRLIPHYQYKRAQEVYTDITLFKSYITRWKDHVNSYESHKDHFILIRFEHLVNFGNDFKKILELFDVNDHYNQIKKRFDLNKMREKSPLHVRSGNNEEWKKFFSKRHKEIFKEIAGDVLIRYGYEDDYSW